MACRVQAACGCGFYGVLARLAFRAMDLRTDALTGGHPVASPSSTSASTVAPPPPSSLVEIDPATGRVVRTIRDVNGTRGLAVGEGGVWALLPARAQASLPQALRDHGHISHLCPTHRSREA